MSEGKSFIVPRNITHLQSLQLLHYIMNFRYDNIYQQVFNQHLNTTELAKMYRLLDDLLIYMRNGICSIERFYKFRLLDAVTEQEDLLYEFENLQILGQDIRILKKECNLRKVTIEYNKLRQYGIVKSFFFRLNMRECKSRFENEEQETAAMQDAERVRGARLGKDSKRQGGGYLFRPRVKSCTV